MTDTEVDEKSSKVSDNIADFVNWPDLLNITFKPDPRETWNQLYDLSNQIQLRNECKSLARNLNGAKSVAYLESLLTLYFKERRSAFKKNSTLDILERILSLGVDSKFEYNMFYAVTTKFVPFDLKPNGLAFQFLRLLVQYHDPVLSLHLESLSITPYDYAKDWLESLLCKDLNLSKTSQLWMHIFNTGDAFQVFFMIAALIISTRDAIIGVSTTQRDAAFEVIANSVRNLNDENDLDDFFEVANYFKNTTPMSAYLHLHYLLFGAHFDEDSQAIDDSLNNNLVLPIKVHEIVKKEEEASLIQYFILDTRSPDDFARGRFKDSYHLDKELFTNDPEKFEAILRTLDSIREKKMASHHYLIVGYGDVAQDDFLNMVISRLLKEGRKHLAVMDGGYSEIHRRVVSTNNTELLDSHLKETCPLCGGSTSKPEKTSRWLSNLVSSTSQALKVSVEGVLETATRHSPSPTVTSHADPKERHGKRYRPRNEEVFSLDNFVLEDDDSGDEVLVQHEPIDVTAIYGESAFDCLHLVSGNQVEGYLVVTDESLVFFEKCSKSKNSVEKDRFSIKNIAKCTSRTSCPEVLTFTLAEKNGTSIQILDKKQFYVNKAGDCAKAVKLAVYKADNPM